MTQTIESGGGGVLLIHAGGLGDFVLSLRVVAALRGAGFAKLTMLGHRWYGDLAGAGEGVDAVLDFDTGGFHTLFSTGGDPPPRVVAALRPHAVAVNMLGGANDTIAFHLRRAGIARVIDLDPRLRRGWKGHVTEQWLADLRAHGIDARAGASRIRIDGAARSAARGRLEDLAGAGGGPLVLLHPGSGGRSKCWPLDSFRELAQALRAEGRRVVCLLGPAEAERWTDVEIGSLREAAPLLQEENLCRVAACLAACDALIGNDSGISHLAAAVGAPVVAVFGPTDPSRWRPLGERVRVVHRASEWPGVDEVLRSCRGVHDGLGGSTAPIRSGSSRESPAEAG